MSKTGQEIDKAINSAVIDLTPELELRFKNDMARDIHERPDIATRYFGDRGLQGMKDYLVSHPWVATDIKTLKALFESDMGTPERAELKSQLGYEETVPTLVAIALNPHAPTKDRLDAIKELRMGGRVGASSGKDASATAGVQFNLTINRADGRKEKFTTVVEPPTKTLPVDDEE